MPTLLTDADVGLAELTDADVGLSSPVVDLTPQAGPIDLAQPGAMPQMPSTTAGGPRVPVASLSQTLQEPLGMVGERVANFNTPKFEVPDLPMPSQSPVTAAERLLLGASPIARNIDTLFGKNTAATVLRQGINQAGNLVEFGTSDMGLATLPAAAVAPMAVSGFFTLDMAKALGNQGLDLYNRWDEMTPEQRAVALTDMGATGAMLLGVGAHFKQRVRAAADKVNPQGTPPVIPPPPVTGEALAQPKGAPAPRVEPPAVERATPEQAAAQADAMTQRAAAGMDAEQSSFRKMTEDLPTLADEMKPKPLPSIVVKDAFADIKFSVGEKYVLDDPRNPISGTVTDVGEGYIVVDRPDFGPIKVVREKVAYDPDAKPKPYMDEAKPAEAKAAPAPEQKPVEAPASELPAAPSIDTRIAELRKQIKSTQSQIRAKDKKLGVMTPPPIRAEVMGKMNKRLGQLQDELSNLESEKLQAEKDAKAKSNDAADKFDAEQSALIDKIEAGEPVPRADVDRLLQPDSDWRSKAKIVDDSPKPPVVDAPKVEPVAEKKGEVPKFSMTFQQFLDAPREGELLDALRKLPRPPVSEAAAKAKAKTDAAYEKLQKANLTWVLDNPSQAIGLSKAKKKLVDAYNKAWSERGAIENAERESRQRFLYDEGVKAGIFEAPPKPDAPPTQPAGVDAPRPGPGASTLADVGAESAAPAAVMRVAEFIDQPRKPDVKTAADDITIPESQLRIDDPAVEQRWQNAKVQRPSWLDKAKDVAVATNNAMTRHFQHLDPKTDGVTSDILRVAENIPNRARFDAGQVLRGFTAQLAPKKFDLYSRIIILRDHLKYSERFGDELRELPFGFKSLDAVKSNLDRFEALADQIPDVREAVKRRDEFMDTLRYDLVSRGLLHEKVKDFGEYFHHQVLAHMALKREAEGGGTGLRTGQKSWQKRRVGSEKDYNTSYLESEFEVISQALQQIYIQDTRKQLQPVVDIADNLKEAAAQAKAEGVDVSWRELLPPGYRLWQPERGNFFYPATTVTERALDAYFRGTRELKDTDLREVLALGGPKEQWAIPERVAKTLDEMVPPKEHAVERVIGAGVGTWKWWTLFNPMRNVIYNINNMSGDLDISIAVDPRILKHGPKAAVDMMDFVRGKAPTPEIREAVGLDVLESGFSTKEMPKFSESKLVKLIEGKDLGLVRKYWDSVMMFNRWREGVLRLAAYRRALDLLNEGKRPYWTSKRAEMDAMYNSPHVTREQIAAKLSREAIGDYGNISHAGQWIRSKLMPFYSWMEINAPRYVRLIQNAPYEGRSQAGAAARVAGVVGRKATGSTAKLAVRAGLLYALMNVWNKTFFPEEERELAAMRDQFHIILGRNEDGSIRSLRFQGAFSDALSWLGLEDVVKDMRDLYTGMATAKDKAKQIAKAPINKVIQASQPIWKTTIEAGAKRTFFPDAFNPRPIRDRMQHVAQLVSMRTLYDYLTKKPQRPGTWGVLSLATYTADPGEAAYNTARSIIADKLKDMGEERAVTDSTDRGNALYYYKQAVKYKDKKLADYWRARYYKLGGTEAGLRQSIDRAALFATVKSENRNKVRAALSPAEKEIVKRAERWYYKTYKPGG